MALLLGDGFDHYTPPFIMDKWDFNGCSGGGLGPDGPSTSYGRLGSLGIQLLGRAGIARDIPGLGKNLGVNVTGFGIIGVAFRLPDMGSSGGAQIISVLEPTVSGDPYVSVFVMANGSLRIESPYGTVVGTTAPGLISALAFRYIEMKVKVHNTAGRVIVRLDSSVVIDTGAGGINTRPFGTFNYFSRVGLGGQISAPFLSLNAVSFDDFYVCDDTGAANNDFLGDVQVQAIFPNGVGGSTQWAIGGTTPAATNWQSVNENPPNNDVTYVKSSTVGQSDLYTMEDVAATASGIKGLLYNARIKKDDATSRSYALQCKSGATTSVLPTRVVPGLYVNQQDPQDVNPTTGVAWTVAEVNAIEAGIKVIT